MSEYRKQLTKSKARVGFVVTAGLVVLFFAVLLAGNLEHLFAPHATVYATFDDVKGLQPGAPVWFAGVQVGTVLSLEFSSGAKIKVPLSIKRGVLAYLKKDSEPLIQTLGLLGDKYVELRPGSPEAAGLQPGDIVSAPQKRAAAEDLAGLIGNLQTKKSTVSRLLGEDTLYRDLEASVKDIKRFAATIKTSGGTLDKIIKDPVLYERFVAASRSLDTFTQKLVESKGTMNRLIEDESLYNNLNMAAIKLNALLDGVNSGRGTVGQLMSDRKLFEDLQKTVAEVNGLVTDVKQNPKKYFSIKLF